MAVRNEPVADRRYLLTRDHSISMRAMRTAPSVWKTVSVKALAGELGSFDRWVLCGGHSVALLAGSDTRAHGDIDIGVFRSELGECLRAIGIERVFLCRDGRHHAWTGGDVPTDVHDIWISDRAGKFWSFQVMVFDDDGDMVIYRRDPRIRWSKRRHARVIDGVRVLNPFVTFLFKANKASMEEKEIHDLVKLIEMGGPSSH